MLFLSLRTTESRCPCWRRQRGRGVSTHPRCGEGLEHHGEVHEREENQQGQVTNDLHISASNRAHEEVLRQPRHTHKGANEDRQQDSDDGYAKRVVKALDERRPDGGALIEVVAWHGEVGGVFQEVESSRNLAALNVDLVVVVQPEDDADEDRENSELEHPLEDSNISPQRSFRRYAC